MPSPHVKNLIIFNMSLPVITAALSKMNRMDRNVKTLCHKPVGNTFVCSFERIVKLHLFNTKGARRHIP